MKREITPLHDGAQTVRKMYRMAEEYCGDLDGLRIRGIPASRMSMMQFYEWVRAIPFKRDRVPVEWIARPGYLAGAASNGLDCKKKSILLGAYLARSGFPSNRWRFVIVSRRKDKHPHHVLPQVKLSGEWYNLDATYVDDVPFDRLPVTYREPVQRR